EKGPQVLPRAPATPDRFQAVVQRASLAAPPGEPTMPMTRAEIALFFDRLAARLPEPKGELEYVNAFTLLVAVVLSAQATDVGVNKATRPLFEVADTPQKMVALGEERLRQFIRTIGLFNTKARNVIALSEIL